MRYQLVKLDFISVIQRSVLLHTKLKFFIVRIFKGGKFSN